MGTEDEVEAQTFTICGLHPTLSTPAILEIRKKKINHTVTLYPDAYGVPLVLHSRVHVNKALSLNKAVIVFVNIPPLQSPN